MDDACKKGLLGIIGKIWSNAIDNTSIMIIEAADNLWLHHPWPEILKNLGES